MQTFDWIVVGNGLTGAAASYELAHQGFSVLLIDQALEPPNATRFSYGGIPYWATTTDLTRTLCQQSLAKHRQLSEELGADTQFRELQLLLTVPPGADIEAIAAQYTQFATPPQPISATEAQALEPLLDPRAIAAAFTVDHGHVSPTALVGAYNQAFQRLGGTRIIAQVTDLVRVKNQVTGVLTVEQAYPAKGVLVAAGAFSRQLLAAARLAIPLYYSHAELIETPPLDLTLNTLIMPAVTQRFALEDQASRPETDPQWDHPGHEITPPCLDSGAIQFQDGHLCLGQISRTLTALDAPVDAASSEHQIRTAIAQVLPALEGVPGTWHRCLVSFCRDGLPLVGPLEGIAGLHLFVGFSAPFAYVPAVAQRFAQKASGQRDSVLEQLSPQRFA